MGHASVLTSGAGSTRRFGPDAPTLNSPAESCYEGILLLTALAQAARSLDVGALCPVANSVFYGGPRGEVRMHSGHLDQRVYLAEADALELGVVAELGGERLDNRWNSFIRKEMRPAVAGGSPRS